MSVIVSHLLVKSDLAEVYAEYLKYLYFHRLFKAEVLLRKNQEENTELQTEIEVVEM